jgi:hypothetical protein
MKTTVAIAFVGLLFVGSGSASGQSMTLEFQNGHVRLNAQNMPVSQILAEWARRGRTTIVNGERVPGPPVTLELNDVPEQQALDIVLRGASGYLVGARETALPGASAFDRILILPTSARPANSAALPPTAVAQQIPDDLDDNDNAPPAQFPGAVVPPGARVQRPIVQTPPNTRPIAPPIAPPIEAVEANEPENRPPATAPNNPFGVAPGTSRPGVINPTPAPVRPPER